MKKIILLLLLSTIAASGCSIFGVERSTRPTIDNEDWLCSEYHDAEDLNRYTFRKDNVTFVLHGFTRESMNITMGPPFIPFFPVLDDFWGHPSLKLEIETNNSDLVINIYEIRIELPDRKYYSPSHVFCSSSKTDNFYPVPDGMFHVDHEKVRFQLTYNNIPKKEMKKAREFTLVFGNIYSDQETVKVPPLKYRREPWKAYYTPVHMGH